MKNNNKIFALLMLILAGFGVGCEKEIPFTAEQTKPKLVINSLFTTDSIWKIDLSNSLSIIDNAYPGPVSGATVEILDENGNLVEALSEVSPGKYESPTQLKPVVGVTYQARAALPNYTTITATNQTPSPIAILSVDTVRVVDSDGYENMEITVNFQDAPGEENYFVLAMPISGYYTYGTDTTRYSYFSSMQTSDPAVSQAYDVEPGSTPYYNQLLLSDQLFSGQSYSLKFTVDGYPWSSGGYEDYSVDLLFYSCSKEFFRYLVSFEAYKNVEGNPFAQPVQVFSNVENGFGIFAGASIFKMNLK